MFRWSWSNLINVPTQFDVDMVFISTALSWLATLQLALLRHCLAWRRSWHCLGTTLVLPELLASLLSVYGCCWLLAWGWWISVLQCRFYKNGWRGTGDQLSFLSIRRVAVGVSDFSLNVFPLSSCDSKNSVCISWTISTTSNKKFCKALLSK